MNYLKEQKREGDVLYVYHGARPAFTFYAPRFYLDKMSVVLGRSSEDDWGDYEKEIEKLRNHKRVWILFSHSQTPTGVDEKRLFLYFLG